MRCPTCHTELHEERFKRVKIDRCPTCMGLWLDQGELNRLVDRRDKMVEFMSIDHDSGIHGDSHPKRDCPHCQETMRKVDLLEEESGVIYDYCPNCKGFWLDQDEVARTKHYLKEHGKWNKRKAEMLLLQSPNIMGPPKPF